MSALPPSSHPAPAIPLFRPSGLWVALLTPFRAGAVDHDALTRLVQRLVADGVDGLVVCGSTGEAAALHAMEKHAVLHTVANAAPGVPLIAGLSAESLHEATAWAAGAAAQHPAVRAVLVPAPAYVRPSQDGLLTWFRRIADATWDAAHCPVVIYDIPYRTGCTISTDTLLTLAEDTRFIGIKDCGGDGVKTQTLIHDGRLAVLAGEDTQAFATLALGGQGAILASAHVATQRWAKLLGQLRQGDMDEARRTWRPMLPLVQALFAEPNPAVIKAVLARLDGALTAETREPLTSSSDEALERAWDAARQLLKEE